MVVGNKVIIRSVEKDDLREFYRWVNDPELAHLYNFTIDFDSYDEIVKSFENSSRLSQDMEFTIIEKSTKKPVGRCKLTDIDMINKKSMCMMYICDKDSEDKGYGTESMRLLMKFAFEDLNLNRLGIWVFDFNKTAIRCYKNCGMKVEGIMREGVYRDGKYHDVYFMGILKHEFEEIIGGGGNVCSEENM